MFVFELAWTFALRSGPILILRPPICWPYTNDRLELWAFVQAYSRTPLGEQFWQLGKNGGDTLCLVASEQLGRCASVSSPLEVDVGERLSIDAIAISF
jgi:hypothetical protein